MSRLVVILGTMIVSFAASSPAEEPATLTPWEQLPKLALKGGLRVFWNVGGAERAKNDAEAVAHGFELITLVNTYSDYPGKQRENINTFLQSNRSNPWQKPEFFERIIRRNTASAGNAGALFVHDIEFPFEEDLDRAWADPAARAASGATDREQFAKAYYRQWASWFALPCQWAKEQYPRTPVGLYGPQPFRRDYWGIAGKTAQQIDGTHRSDAELWQHIAPAVDFSIASVYLFYDDPGSIYYLASNVEENRQRLKQMGNKPLYAYEWLRYHDSNQKLRGQELAPYLVEAMAVLPYFCGADGVALWGFEPKGTGPYYQRLPLFMESLGRLNGISARLASAKPLDDEPAHVLWKERRPLVRRLQTRQGECLVLAVNPWQAADAVSTIKVRCGPREVSLELRGRHTEIYSVVGGKARRVEFAK